MAVELHHCQNMACKCNADEDADYCNRFCEEVESSEDDRKCGCGHMACDYTKQMGNEQTFGSTGT